MVADDDLLLSAGAIEEAFAIFLQYGLQLGQMSQCRWAAAAAIRERVRGRLCLPTFPPGLLFSKHESSCGGATQG